MNQATASGSVASEKTVAGGASSESVPLGQATPVSGREMEDISESESDLDGEETAPVSCFYLLLISLQTIKIYS